MYRKVIHMILLILAVGVVLTSFAKAADPDLVGWWKLDEGTGTRASDSSGQGNHGSFQGNPQWVAGKIGQALQFDGVDDYVEVPHDDSLTVDNEVTVMAWINTERHNSAGGDWQAILAKSNDPRSYSFYTYTNGTLHFSTAGIGTNSSGQVPLNEWVHVAAMLKEGQHFYYINGELAGMGGSGITLPGTADTATFRIGLTQEGGNHFLVMIDDARLYRRALTQEEIQLAMKGQGQPYALGPNPEDGAMHEDTWVTLTWSAGYYTVSHDVYLGDIFDDVNDGTNESETFRGNFTDEFFVAGFFGFPYPEGLVPGTTYYWRIDEVNDANTASPWKGDVWSFTVPSKKAYNPDPTDGDDFTDAEALTLSWTAGFGAILHTVYFGDDYDTVANATGGPLLPQVTYDTGTLEPDKTYFWRVDAFDSATTHKGNVWSFTTLPYIPITDPNLVGWWKFDEGSGVHPLDGSGHGNHGTLIGDPQWIIGIDGDALEFDGVNDWVEVPHDTTLTVDNEVTVMAWINAERHSGPGEEEWQGIISKSNDPRSYSFYTYQPGTLHFGTAGVGSTSSIQVPLNEWVHVCAMVIGGQHQYYINGEDAGTGGSGIVLPGSTDTSNVFIGRTQEGLTRCFLGMIDDARIYNKALTQEEVQQVMRGDPSLAWDPSPAHRSTPDIYNAASLSWQPGENAAQHDVYFGTDKDAVEDADTTTADIYRGRQAATSYSPPEGVVWGGGPYYWRIDENNTDGTISKGKLWSFTAADFILVDDFEGYDSGDNQIWYFWHDGLGYGTPETQDYYPGNGTGSAVGDENTASYTEESIVNSGLQSIPFVFNNNKQGYANYSETELTLTAPRDWTVQDVAELSLWFRGYPGSVGSFVEGPAGTYTMTASGSDIWLVNQVEADEFHFAFKMLTGAGSIVARVDSVENTHVWAKAGVMIRETLDPDSAHATMVVTPGSGISFQRRPGTGQTSLSTTTAGIEAPYWVKIERSISGSFTASSSANGTAWTMLGTPENVPMGANVYIGLALTAHDATLTCQAVFSNVTTTGNVTGQWAHQDIGIASNDAEPLYVAVSNSTGSPAVVVHDDPAVSQIDTWTEWVIPLQAFADQGIVLTDVDRIAIGLGTRGNMTVPGGSGKMFIDDIRLYRPGEAAE